MENDDNEKVGQFSIRVRVGNAEVEVSASDRDFVLDESRRLIEQFGLNGGGPHTTALEIVHGEVETLPTLSQTRVTKPETLGEFLKQFGSLQTNLDKILVFGYWCEIKQGQPHFTLDDIVAKYKEVRETAPKNPRRDLSSLVSKGFLLPPDKSDDGEPAYAVSRSGIKEVESKMSQV